MDTIVDILIESRFRELTDGFKVRRVLPSSRRRMVGPFIFVDQMGPEILTPGTGLDVAPHPHIGLATVTYLFAGELMHRDSLGSVQKIRPGEVNWMTAGSGIVHSERTPEGNRTAGSELFGIQSWVALPSEFEESTPTFRHHSVQHLPLIEDEGLTARLIAGSLYGVISPVQTYSPLVYADVELAPGARMSLPAEYQERALFVVAGSIDASGTGPFTAGQLIVFHPNFEILIVASAGPAHFMVIGGEPVGPRHIWWNFVSSSKERIEQAKKDWREGKFAHVPDETEFIPLPVDPREVIVRYP